MRVPQCLRDRQRGRNWHWSLDRLLQHQSTALDLRRQDARRGLCYAGRRGEIGGVTETQIHLSQAAKLSRKTDPLLLLVPVLSIVAIAVVVWGAAYVFQYFIHDRHAAKVEITIDAIRHLPDDAAITLQDGTK